MDAWNDLNFNELMANSRCTDCNSVITRNERKCWVCGEPVAGARKSSFMAWLWGPAKPQPGKGNGKKSPVPDVAARVAYFSATNNPE
jgi:hypothetical protein